MKAPMMLRGGAWRLALVVLGAFGAGAVELAAQATGVVQGRVVEAATQAPLANAQVHIAGTAAR